MKWIRTVSAFIIIGFPSYLLGSDFGFSVGVGYFVAACFIASAVGCPES